MSVRRLIVQHRSLRLVVLELPVAQASDPLTDLRPRLDVHAVDAGLQPRAQPTLVELPDVNHPMVPCVVQPGLPAPGGEPLRAADDNVEGLLAGTATRANKHACDE